MALDPDRKRLAPPCAKKSAIRVALCLFATDLQESQLPSRLQNYWGNAPECGDAVDIKLDVIARREKLLT